MTEFAPLLAHTGPFRNPALLATALTHRSWVNEQPTPQEDNERLEFLGDAVLDFVVGSYLFRRFPAMREGEMTALRAALVRAEALADFARQWEIDTCLRLGYGEAETGGRQKIATLSAAFEAVIGALWLDQGLRKTKRLIEQVIEPALGRIMADASHRDAKSRFQEWAQGMHNITPHYRVISADGPDHARHFTVQLLLGDAVWAEGEGTSKQRAEQAAALSGLQRATDQ
jgi:ribonuclease-3